MQILRFKILSIIFTIFFLSRGVLAASIVQTEFELLLPRTFQQDLIERQWQELQDETFKFSFHVPDQIYETPDVKVLLEGMDLNLQTMLEKPDVDPGGGHVILHSRDLRAHLEIRAVTVDQYIIREIGGVIGRFRIQGRCENISMDLRPEEGTIQMKLRPIFKKGLVSAKLEELQVHWDADAWRVQDFHCTGVEGFEDLVREEVLKLTRDPSVVESRKAEVMAYIQDYIDSKSLDLSKPRAFATSRPDIRASISIQDFQNDPHRFFMRGILKIEFSEDSEKAPVSLRLSKAPVENISEGGVSIRVPEGLVPAVTQRVMNSGPWFERFSSANIPGFTALMKSRWSQFWVWPELLRYPKNTVFLFDLGAEKKVTVSGTNLKYKLKAPLQSLMYAPQADRYVPFMRFRLPLQSDVFLSLEQGHLVASFENIDLGLQYEWDPIYAAKYRRYKKFAAKTILPRLKKGMEGSKVSYKLPQVRISDSVSLRVQKLQSLRQGDLLIRLK